MSKLNNLLAIGNDVLSSKLNNFGASIYKEDLFSECRTDKEKKYFRTKLRRKLSTFLDEFYFCKKDVKKLAELKKVWNEYAKNIYKDVNIICDSNSKIDKQNICKEFLKAMEIEKKPTVRKLKNKANSNQNDNPIVEIK